MCVSMTTTCSCSSIVFDGIYLFTLMILDLIFALRVSCISFLSSKWSALLKHIYTLSIFQNLFIVNFLGCANKHLHKGKEQYQYPFLCINHISSASLQRPMILKCLKFLRELVIRFLEEFTDKNKIRFYIGYPNRRNENGFH